MQWNFSDGLFYMFLYFSAKTVYLLARVCVEVVLLIGKVILYNVIYVVRDLIANRPK